MTPSRGPGQRAGLTREAILRQARALLAEEGPDALSMRALARRLDVAPNTIYSYVQDKNELLDALLDGLLADVKAPDPETVEPVAGLYHVMASTYRVLTAHPELVPLFLARQGARGENAIRLGAVMDRMLARAGLEGQAAVDARWVLIVHAIGSAAFATGGPLANGGTRRVPPGVTDRNFGRSLQWLLAGITR